MRAIPVPTEIEEAKIHSVAVRHSLAWQRAGARAQVATQREGEPTDALAGTIDYCMQPLKKAGDACTVTVVEASSLPRQHAYKPTRTSAKVGLRHINKLGVPASKMQLDGSCPAVKVRIA
jgi:hypothetical protein